MSFPKNDLMASTIAAINAAVAQCDAETKGREYGAPTGLSDAASQHEKAGNLALAIAYLRKASANTIGHSRTEMYDRDAWRLERELDRNIRSAANACKRQS